MIGESGPWPRWARVLLGGWTVAVGVVLGVYLHSLVTEDDSVIANGLTKKHHQPKPLSPSFTETRSGPASQLRPASAGTNGSSAGTNHRSAHRRSSFLSSNAEASFAELEGSLSAQVGVSVAPFGSAPPKHFGSLQVGHAWSSFKVPVLVTLMKQGPLSAEEQSQATAAVTASDNEAAAALFARLGDLSTASADVEAVLAESGYPTEVATAPPPPGAVSTWGQTEWPLDSSVGFYRALACGRLLGSEETEYVLNLMENVIPEQQWGLGEAGIAAQVAIKAGWGPDGSESGPYLVRQAGVLRSGSSGAVVTIAAQDDSGSFEAGIQDLDALAGWVRDNVRVDTGACDP